MSKNTTNPILIVRGGAGITGNGAVWGMRDSTIAMGCESWARSQGEGALAALVRTYGLPVRLRVLFHMITGTPPGQPYVFAARERAEQAGLRRWLRTVDHFVDDFHRATNEIIMYDGTYIDDRYWGGQPDDRHRAEIARHFGPWLGKASIAFDHASRATGAWADAYDWLIGMNPRTSYIEGGGETTLNANRIMEARFWDDELMRGAHNAGREVVMMIMHVPKSMEHATDEQKDDWRRERFEYCMASDWITPAIEAQLPTRWYGG